MIYIFRTCIYLLMLVFALPFGTGAQTMSPLPNRTPPPPKREFRAVWVATVLNIDYPRRPDAQRVAIKEQYKNMLDEYQRMGFNAVIMQVRPAADAFYPSELAPWSAYLTGRQGQAPEPADFDPLAYMIEETHKRSMEFHAWLNPYRATVNMDTLNLSAKHPFFKHRDWLVPYGTRLYFNPGLPEVRQHLLDVVSEVVERYDIDAIHFDDYFYPYPIRGVPFPDSTQYYIYGRGFKQIEDWRRSNVDGLIEALSVRIKALKPHVKFGISPFGVWRNKSVDPMGSDTRAGVTTYDDLYADVLKWVRQGWIDYLIPQLYWNIGYPPADYAILLDWWGAQVRDRHLYIGQAAYKVRENPEPAWQDPDEIPRQIALNRSRPQVLGSAYFSSRSILNNPLDLKESLRREYRIPALLPEMGHLEVAANSPPDFRPVRSKQGKVKLKWRPDPSDSDHLPAYFVVYRFPGPLTGNFEDPGNILHITPFLEKRKKWIFLDGAAQPGQVYNYAVTSVSRRHAESRPAPARVIEKKARSVKRLRMTP